MFYVEVEVDASPRVEERLKISQDGQRVAERKVVGRARIDLVAVRGDTIVGYEVKSCFEDFCGFKTWEKLEDYVGSECFDKVYAVVPADIAKRVLGYRDAFEKRGVGLIALDPTNGSVASLLEAKRLSRTRWPKLERNEAWLKHILGMIFRKQGYSISLEVYVPKPLALLRTHDSTQHG